jgi:mono/diheme cytochrome c family protein
MDANRISEQEKRENADPSEAGMPIPFGIFALVVGMVLFAAIYILTDHQPLPSELGDQRTLQDLLPKAQAPAAASGNSGAVLDGAPIYAARCAACHQPTGAGLPGVFPPLAGSEWVTGKDEVLAKILLHGVTGELTVKGASFKGAMPAFKDQLKDEEIAAVATHMRSQWGNKASAVAAEVVAKARSETASRSTPWNGDAELAALK